MKYFNLVLDIVGDWTVQRDETRGKEMLTISVPDCANSSILIFGPLPGREKTLMAALEHYVERHTAGREIVNRFPDEVLGGATKGGLAFAAQHAVSTGEDEDDIWYAMYWALAANDDVQCAVGMSADPDVYEELLEHFGAFVDRLRARS